MKRLLPLVFLLTLLVKISAGQEQLSVRQQADKLYERYEYFKALRLYLKLAERKHPAPTVLERIAGCFKNINAYEDAEAWYARAVADSAATNSSHYYYAEMLLRNNKTGQARQQYLRYFSKAPDTALMRLKMFSCDSASLWAKEKPDYSVAIAARFNTNFSEWGLSPMGRNGWVFTSDRRLYSNAVDERTGNSWYKLYQADAGDGQISEMPIVSNQTGQYLTDYHVGPAVFNAAADTAYITITTEVEGHDIALDAKTQQKLYTRRLLLIVAVKRNNLWVETGQFPYNDINKYSLGHAALSKNGRTIYFTSDMPGGQGKTDIWYCEKQSDGKWGKPVNCGATINTKEEEAFPEIGGDGALYYSSKGLPGMGGYDIFKAIGEKTDWAVPQNLKWPLNSTSDDFCLITADGQSGYFSSNRQNGKGSDDIYQFNPVTKPAKPVGPPATVVVAKAPPQAGLHESTAYGVNNIYYDLDKSNIRPDAALELDKLVALLRAHPNFKVSIASHTDSRAPGDYNYALSQRRSASAALYLIKNDIAPERLFISAYGETRLLNECADGVPCTEAQQQLNRRTEFRIFE